VYAILSFVYMCVCFGIQELETLNVSAEFLISEKYLAKYEFGGSTDIELRFRKGNVVTVIEKAENGWWKGICEGQVGWFPESYVRPAPKSEANHAPNATAAQEERQQVEQPRGMDEMMASGDCHMTSCFYICRIPMILHSCSSVFSTIKHTHTHLTFTPSRRR
jgi:hypothetical protein